MPPASRAAARGWLRRGAAALAGVLLTGCAFGPPLTVAELTQDPSARVELDVPFFAQEDYQCGPAALAGILTAAGVPATPDRVASMIYLPQRRGSLQAEILAATRRLGRIPYVAPPEPARLLAQITAQQPVLVLQNLATRSFPRWHYAVVVGYDAQANQVVLNSGTREKKRVPARTFFRTWEWAQRWSVVALAPGQLPARPDPDRYVAAVAAFEPVAGPALARVAWRRAVAQWPRDPRPHLALGNLAYGQGDAELAAQHYRNGLQHNAAAPALVNNLAAVLGDLGCPARARALIEPVAAATSAQSPWHAVMQTTLAELDAHRGPDRPECAHH